MSCNFDGLSFSCPAFSVNPNERPIYIVHIKCTEITNPCRKEFSRVEVGTDMPLLVKVAEVGLQCKPCEQEAFLLSDRLVVVEEVVTQLQVVLQSCCLLSEHRRITPSTLLTTLCLFCDYRNCSSSSQQTTISPTFP